AVSIGRAASPVPPAPSARRRIPAGRAPQAQLARPGRRVQDASALPAARARPVTPVPRVLSAIAARPAKPEPTAQPDQELADMAKTLKAPHWWQALSVNVFGTTHAIVGGLATVPDEHAPVLEGFGFRPHDVAPPVVPDVAPAAPAEQL